MKSHVFRGTRWRLGNVKARRELGGCEGPHISGREIDIPVGGSRQQDLDTCIHESIHACLWDLDEEAVSESATDIAALLWRLGWRKKK